MSRAWMLTKRYTVVHANAVLYTVLHTKLMLCCILFVCMFVWLFVCVSTGQSKVVTAHLAAGPHFQGASIGVASLHVWVEKTFLMDQRRQLCRVQRPAEHTEISTMVEATPPIGDIIFGDIQYSDSHTCIIWHLKKILGGNFNQIIFNIHHSRQYIPCCV